jgi:hypothetical protein
MSGADQGDVPPPAPAKAAPASLVAPAAPSAPPRTPLTAEWLRGPPLNLKLSKHSDDELRGVLARLEACEASDVEDLLVFAAAIRDSDLDDPSGTIAAAFPDTLPGYKSLRFKLKAWGTPPPLPLPRPSRARTPARPPRPTDRD